MKDRAQVVVIGGGVVGCSVLYHLTKLGWFDVMLIERSELTSGSTWHAAGGFHTLNGDTNMAALQGYTIKLYKELEELTGQSCGLHHVGGLTLADSQGRMDMLKAERGKHRYMGLHTEIIGVDEIAKLSSITNLDGILGALYDPLDGHLDPSGTTHAYAKAAKMGGAEIVLRNPIIETNPRPDGSWEVVTVEGTVIAEHIVNAAGLWAREVGALAGVYLPLHPMEHQYLVTEQIPEIANLENEHPHIVDPGSESYLRQERDGLCIGFYEQNCTLWAVDGTPLDFGHELLEENLERVASALEATWKRYPILEKAGIKNVINGPFTFAPDGNPLVGAVPGLRHYWSACGVMAGFSQAGGVGLTLAQMMIEGEPAINACALDVARYGDWVTPSYTRVKAQEFYRRRFSVSYPNEELEAARPFRKSPIYQDWADQGAIFSGQYGLEVVNLFSPDKNITYEEPSFRRSNVFDFVGAEVMAVRQSVGMNEVSNFGKYRISGRGAREFLSIIMAGRIPKKGRVTLSPMLSPKGRIIGDFTITSIDDHCYQLTASYTAQAFHLRWFLQQKRSLGFHHLTIENISDSVIGLQIAGPNARALLTKIARGDVSDEAFKFMDAKFMDIGLSHALVQRLSFTGDLGYEIYVPAFEQKQLYDVIKRAGEEFDLKPFGMRAMMSLRLDRFFGAWLREYSPDYTALETGLDRFIDWKKNSDYIGKDAVLAERQSGPDKLLFPFEVDASDADVVGYEPVWVDGEVVGFVTSGGYSHYAKKSIAFGFLPSELANNTDEVEIEILGEKRKAIKLTKPLLNC